jgi:LuxR family maltose regulon positive regulatory protein
VVDKLDTLLPDVQIERPQLDTELSRACQKKSLVYVIAGAGFAKTQAVYHALQKFESSAVWISFCPEDNQPEYFWRHLINDLELKERCLLDGQQSAAIIQYFNASVRRRVCVLDNFHSITNSAVLKHMEDIFVNCHPVCFILISRGVPEIDSLTSQVQNRVAWFDERDLRFSQEEFFMLVDRYDYRLTLTDKIAVYQYIQGWPLAAALFCSNLARSASVDVSMAVNKMQRTAFQYFDREIFSALDDETQKAVIALSLLQELPSSFLDRSLERGSHANKGRLMRKEVSAITENILNDVKTVDEAMVNWKIVEKLQMFFIYHAQKESYTVQPLFLEYLQAKHTLLREEEKRLVYQRTAAWCVKNNRRRDAVLCYLKIQCYHEVMDIILDYPMMSEIGTSAFFLEQIEKIQPSAREDEDDYYWVVLKYVFVPRFLFELRRYDEGAYRAKQAIAFFERSDKSFAEIVVYSNYNTLGFISLRTCVDTHRYDFREYFVKADELFTRQTPHVLPLPPGTGRYSEAIIPWLACGVGNDAAPDEYKQYLSAIRCSVPRVSHSIPGFYNGFASLAACEYAFFREKMDISTIYAYQALAEGKTDKQFMIISRVQLYLLRISLCKGDLDALSSVFEASELLHHNPSFDLRQICYDLNLGWFYAQLGILEEYPGWLKTHIYHEDLSASITEALPIIQAKYLLSAKRYGDLLDMPLSHTREIAIGDFLLGNIELTLLRAVAKYRLNDLVGAACDLGYAYRLAAPFQFTMPFVELGEDMKALTKEALRAQWDIPAQWLTEINKKTAVYEKNRRSVAAYFVSLMGLEKGFSFSERERKILVDLQQGFTYVEIGAKHYISVNTVKSSIRTIYNKLGAMNKVEALRIAQERQII